MKESNLEMLEDCQQELEDLKSMIREASTLDDLNYLHQAVGPTKVERVYSDERLDKLSEIAVDCQWEERESQISLEAHEARAE